MQPVIRVRVGRLDDIIRRNQRAREPNLVGLAVSTVEEAFDPTADPDDRRRKQIAWAIVLVIVAIGAIALAIAVRSSGGARGGTVYDRKGREVDLATLWRNRRVVIVFYPNLSCEACRAELAELDERRGEFDATIIGIAAEPAAQADNLHMQLDLHFELYADPTFTVTTKWGVPVMHGNQTLPAVFVVEPDGEISYQRVADRFEPFPATGDVIAATKRR